MSAPLPIADLAEDLTFLAEQGVGATEAARRTGFSCVKSLERWMRRHDLVPLLNRLTRQDYGSVTPSRKRWAPPREKRPA